MGLLLVVAGIAGFIGTGVIARAHHKRNNPEAVRQGLPPVPGSGDVPAWTSVLYFGSIAVVVAGIVVWIVG